MKFNKFSERMEHITDIKERITHCERNVKNIDYKYSDEIARFKNSQNVLKSKFSAYENEISLFSRQVKSFEKHINLLSSTIERAKENMSSLIVNHKVEVSQQIFRFRGDYNEITSIVQENNQAMAKFKEKFPKYEVGL